MKNASTDSEIEKLYTILEQVKDPEIPVLSILDLGIVRKVTLEDNHVQIDITPTYTACPAMGVIAMDLVQLLNTEGYRNVVINTVLSPAWTTDWMTESGKEKLKAYGIAAPHQKSKLDKLLFGEQEQIECPQCNSLDTKKISEFGSTACKALYQCNVCKEPFDYFKCH